jgi:ABC-type cobalamin/Fe3+-siderophores transport system ATPase subunit
MQSRIEGRRGSKPKVSGITGLIMASISKITLTIKNYRCFVEPVTIDLTGGFTAFVGVNNAGKSAIMRFILEFRHLFSQIANPNGLVGSIRAPQNAAPFQHVNDSVEVFSNRSRGPLEFWFDFHYEHQPNHLQPIKLRIVVERNLTWRSYITTNELIVPEQHQVSFGGPNNSELLIGGALRCNLTEIFNVGRVLQNSLFIGPFRNAINVGSNGAYLDIQVGQAFIKQFRNLKAGPSRRQNEAVLRLTNQIKEIFEFEDFNIDATAAEDSLHFTVNGRPYKQHELGSGLVQFVLVLANASVRSADLILIDEPELNLHPRLQLDFLTTLGAYAGEGKVWFATHSIGLARSAAERIYSVVRRGDGDSFIRPLAGTPRLAEFLGEMSFSGHKELGFEEILLVEGPTEVKVFQHFLRGMGREHKVLVLPLHGRMPQADDFEETLRITTNIAVVIDSERTEASAALRKDRQSFVDLCRERGILCKVLDRRAIENYFPDHVVKSVFGASYRALGPFEKLNAVNPHWSKDQNWKLALNWPLKEVFENDLGEFLRARYGG